MSIAPTRTLILLNLLLAAGLGYLWLDQNGKLKSTSWVAPVAVDPVFSTSVPSPIAANDPVAFTETLERPLFAQDRRPPPPAALSPPPPDPMADVRLLGLVSGESGGALIKSEGKVRNVKLNQKLGDWTLRSVEDRAASFARGAETRVLKLEYARLGKAASPTATKGSDVRPVSAPSAATPELINAAQRQNEENEARQRYREQLHKSAIH